jgi:hypothetical protein
MLLAVIRECSLSGTPLPKGGRATVSESRIKLLLLTKMVLFSSDRYKKICVYHSIYANLMPDWIRSDIL